MMELEEVQIIQDKDIAIYSLKESVKSVDGIVQVVNRIQNEIRQSDQLLKQSV